MIFSNRSGVAKVNSSEMFSTSPCRSASFALSACLLLSWSSRKISMVEFVLGGRPGGYACENSWKSLFDARARGSAVGSRAVG